MEESAATAALVGMALAMVEIIKKLVSRNDSGDPNRNLEYKLEVLDNKIRGIGEKFDALQHSFYEFREETRIRWAKTGDDDK